MTANGIKLHVIRLQVPPLRDRPEDVAVLAEHFWRNAAARGCVRPALLPPVVTGATSVTALRLTEARSQLERRCLEVALARAGGNRSKAAAPLGLSRQGLLEMMARLGGGDEINSLTSPPPSIGSQTIRR